jgi:hypothetical protein
MGVVFDNFHRQNDFYIMQCKWCIMGEENENDWEEHFDTGSNGEDAGGESNTNPAEPKHPDVTTIAQLIEEALAPLQESIDTLTEVYLEEPPWCERLSKLIKEVNKPIKGTTPDPDDSYNISALKFQAAMLQPCNGQILPAAVRDEIDRLYKIEAAHKISERAERALNHILYNDPIMIKLPDNQDDRLLFMSVLNGWYTQAHPNRAPLKLSPGGDP